MHIHRLYVVMKLQSKTKVKNFQIESILCVECVELCAIKLSMIRWIIFRSVHKHYMLNTE